ncbi:hypothetical protein Y013_03535 [Rhodococcus pyridinivorans SB3094]|uniref:Uncharacterized protein n=1 Tax=Rhodococcus pyridinivorans SB3094 TaxID=1435356 RepID=V9XJG1_9NOCA|nr:hypothetical protein Y013_03535 [Rhodococcus pyridinivorans SB3094]
MANIGRNRSVPMHTPATTTREWNGADVRTESSMPGVPTHSKMTGRFGVVVPSFSAMR